MQYSRDQRNATKELHLVKFDEELPEIAGGPWHASRTGGNQLLRFDDRVPQIERQSARRASKQNEKICLAWCWHEKSHAKCCHALPGAGNALRRRRGGETGR
jgi:hypothetical protein